jgi:hypothetical protein
MLNFPLRAGVRAGRASLVRPIGRAVRCGRLCAAVLLAFRVKVMELIQTTTYGTFMIACMSVIEIAFRLADSLGWL